MTLRPSSAAVSCIYLENSVDVISCHCRTQHANVNTVTDRLTAVAKMSTHSNIRDVSKKLSQLEHCSKSVMNFSTGDTFCHKKFNYYLLLLVQTYIVLRDFGTQ